MVTLIQLKDTNEDLAFINPEHIAGIKTKTGKNGLVYQVKICLSSRDNIIIPYNTYMLLYKCLCNIGMLYKLEDETDGKDKDRV